MLAIAIFAFVYWGLYKIDPTAFTNVPPQGFLAFLTYSLGLIGSADISSIQAWSPGAIILTVFEVLTALVILVIGAYSLLSAARDTYKEDFADFAGALHETAAAVDERIVTKCSLTAEQLEMAIAVESAAAVNFLRRLRGLPPLPTPDETHSDE